MAETAYERFLKDTTKDEAVEIDIKDQKPIDLDEVKFKIQETLTNKQNLKNLLSGYLFLILKTS